MFILTIPGMSEEELKTLWKSLSPEEVRLVMLGMTAMIECERTKDIEQFHSLTDFVEELISRRKKPLLKHFIDLTAMLANAHAAHQKVCDDGKTGTASDNSLDQIFGPVGKKKDRDTWH
jgi:hypothetical protein